MRQVAVVALSLVPVVLGSGFADVFWMVSSVVDPLWRASFALLTWVVGFAIGTRLFWRLTLRIRTPGDEV